MAFLTDLLFSGLGTLAANHQNDKIAKGYTAAENTATQAYSPYATLGQGGATRLEQMATPGFKYTPADPSYAWRFDQGLQAQDRSANARGELLSGGQLKALTRYGQGLASTEYGADWNRNAGLIPYGLTAAGGISDAAFAGAQGRASAYGAKGTNNANFWGGVQGSWNNAGSDLAKLFGGG